MVMDLVEFQDKYNMKKFFIYFVAFLAVSCVEEKRDIRIACVGDSITEGTCINWQSTNSYPTQLDSLLGDGYEVMNFGRAATTMMKNGDFPYWSAKEFTNTMRFHPDFIIIKLGTNDSKSHQWNAESFKASYQEMIDVYSSLTPKPIIKLCTPAPVVEDRWGITDSVVVNGVIPIVKELAKSNSLEIIDINDALMSHKDLFADGVHPTKEGALIIASEVAKSIRK